MNSPRNQQHYEIKSAGGCGLLSMSSWGIGLMTLTLLLVLCIPCSTRDDLQHCDTSLEPQFKANCTEVGVIRIKQVYFGTGNTCPPNNQTTCVLLTERLRLNCNRFTTCTTAVVGTEGIPQQCDGDTVYVEYECIPNTDREIKALTISSLSGPAVWLRSSNNPMEADDINRQLCRINADGNGTILIDFLDLSYTGNTSQSSPYCVYWGKSDSICANKASERQVFQVQNHSNLHNTSFTILFWSNNYIQTTEARFWIEIRGNDSMSMVSVECGLSVLDHSNIATPEPYWLPTTTTDQSSFLTDETRSESPAGSLGRNTDNTFLAAVISGVLVAVCLLVALIVVLYICLYRRSRKQQSDEAPTGIIELTTSQGENIHRAENVYMISSDDEAVAIDSTNMASRAGRSVSIFTNVYDAVDDPHGQSNSLDLPQPTGALYSHVMNGKLPEADNTVSSSGPYDHIQSPDESTPVASSPKTPGEPHEAPDTAPIAVYSLVNKPQKRASPHPALSGNESKYKSIDSTYEQTGSNATDTGEIDLMENDLYEPSADSTHEPTGSSAIDKGEKDMVENDLYETSVDKTYEQTGSSATNTSETDLIENDLYEISETLTNKK